MGLMQYMHRYHSTSLTSSLTFVVVSTVHTNSWYKDNQIIAFDSAATLFILSLENNQLNLTSYIFCARKV